MKRYIIVLFLIISLVGCSPLKRRTMETIKGDEVLYIKDNTLFLELEDRTKEIDKFEGGLETINWSEDGRHFLVNEKSRTSIYERESLKKLGDFSSNGNSIFSKDGKRVLLAENQVLKIYKIAGGLEEVLRADKGDIIIPKSLVGNDIVYEVGDKEIKFTLVYSDEEILKELITSKGNSDKVISYLSKINFNKYRELYGETSIDEILGYLKENGIASETSLEEFLNLINKFNDEEYYRYIEVLGEVYLKDIINFTRAIYNCPDKDRIVHSLHDLKLYDRDDVDLTEDLSRIINSEDLRDEEKSLGISIITSYVDCGT